MNGTNRAYGGERYARGTAGCTIVTFEKLPDFYWDEFLAATGRSKHRDRESCDSGDELG